MAQLKNVFIPLDELAEFEGNPRQKTDRILRRLAKSIAEFGFVDPLVVWGNSAEYEYPPNVVIGGHRRLDTLRALREEGVKLGDVDGLRARDGAVPCVLVRATVGQAKALNVALNKIGEEFDIPALKDWLVEVDAGDFDIEVTGFTEEEIAGLVDYEPKSGLTVDDAVPGAAPPICKKGDLWELGDHRLLCGDATKAEDVARLMAGEKVDMIFTDPPYNIAVGSSHYTKKFKYWPIEGDKQKPEEWEAFNRAWIRNIVGAVQAGDIYVWGAPSPEGMRQRLWLVELGAHWSATIIWYKNCHLLSPAKYQRQYEPCFYGWFGAKSSFRSDRKQTEVWEFDRPSRSDEHPTMKPIAMCAYGIRNSSAVGAVVWDGFGGSGSTLIACEKTGRRCRMLEIAPRYCDVIIKRWEEFTGRRAKLVKNTHRRKLKRGGTPADLPPR